MVLGLHGEMTFLMLLVRVDSCAAYLRVRCYDLRLIDVLGSGREANHGNLGLISSKDFSFESFHFHV